MKRHPIFTPSQIWKKDLGGRRFATEQELKNAVINFFQKMDRSWYASGIEKLVTRYDKCLQRGGDYVEK